MARADELDHRELLELDPEGGVIRFAGQRALLLDAVAMGLLRKYLVQNFGVTAGAWPRPCARAPLAIRCDPGGQLPPGVVPGGSGGSDDQQRMHRVAARMPISPQVGHVRSSGGGPRASTLTISAQAARSSSAGGTVANWRSIAVTRERSVATDLSP